MITSDKWRICLSSVMLLLSISLLWWKIILHSDSLFLERLARDILVSGGKWSDWRFTPAPAYFPDMMLYFASYKLLPSAAARLFFVSGAQALLLTFASFWTAKRLAPHLTKGAFL